MRILIICLGLSLAACEKEKVNDRMISDENSMADSTGMSFNSECRKMLLQGSFENAVHDVSGNVKIYEDADKKRTLVIENFKTDTGPDLRIYLAEDRSVTNFIQLTDKVQNGNIRLDIPVGADLEKQNHLLIWCKKFSVLFGFAHLKQPK